MFPLIFHLNIASDKMVCSPVQCGSLQEKRAARLADAGGSFGLDRLQILLMLISAIVSSNGKAHLSPQSASVLFQIGWGKHQLRNTPFLDK